MVSVVARNVFYGFRRGKGRFLWFPSLVFYGFRRGKERLFMVSVVVLFYGFRLLQDRGCLSDGNRKTTTRTFPRRTKYIYIYIYIISPPWINKPLLLIKSRGPRKLINAKKKYQTTQILKNNDTQIVWV